MIYRIIAVITSIIAGSVLFFINLVMKDFVAYAKNKELTFERSTNRFLKVITRPRSSIITGMIILLAGVLLNFGSLLEYITTGRISQHWIYTLTGAFLFIEGTVVFVFGVAQHIIHVYKRKF
jgi:hypothetical protein